MKHEDIIHIIEDSTAYHLANSYDLIPEKYQHALEDMVKEFRRLNISPYVIRKKVAHDVTLLVEGSHLNWWRLDCYQFINQRELLGR